MKQLWYRFLAWTYRQRRDAFFRVEMLGSFDGPIDRTIEHRDVVFVFTRYNVYLVSYDYSLARPYVRRLA